MFWYNSPLSNRQLRRGLHSSESDPIDHYTVRGLDANNLSVKTIHLYANGDAHGWPNGGKNGGRHYLGDKSELSYKVRCL
jgi:hypothetical protein